MNRYLVSYDLVTPGRQYAALYSALETLGGCRVLLSQWLVRTNLSASQLRDYLMKFVDANDRILVNDFSDWAAYNTLINISRAA